MININICLLASSRKNCNQTFFNKLFYFLVTSIEHNSDDIKVQKQKDEDLFEPLKGIELDISSEIEEGLDPIERRLAPKPLKHVEEPKRPPLTLPPKEPIFECTSPPEPKPRKEPEPEVTKVEGWYIYSKFFF